MEISRQDGMPDIPKNLPTTLFRGVLIKKCQFEVEGKIWLPETTQSLPNIGWIVGIGDDLKGLIAVGQKVLFNTKANLWINHEGVTYLGVHENDVYCKVEKDGDQDVLIPFNKAILIEDIATDVIYAGLYLPQNQKVVNYGKVIAVGHDADKRIKPKQKVVYNCFADITFLFGSKKVHAMYDQDVQFILNDEDFAGTQDLGHERRPDVPLDKLPRVDEKPEPMKGSKTFGLGKNK